MDRHYHYFQGVKTAGWVDDAGRVHEDAGRLLDVEMEG